MRKVIFVSILLILVLCSCGSLSSLVDEPTVVLNRANPVAFKGFDSKGVNLEAKLDVTNNASIAIPRTNIDYELYVANYPNPFTSGSMEKTSSIGSGETITVDVPVAIGVQQLFQHGPSLIAKSLAGESVPYTIKMKIGFSVFPLISISREVKGEMPLPSPAQLF